MFLARSLRMAAQPSFFKLGLIQLAVGSDKATNLSRAVEKVREAAQNGANIVALPVSSGQLCVFSYCLKHVFDGSRSVSTVRMVASTSRSMQRQCQGRLVSLDLRLGNLVELSLR